MNKEGYKIWEFIKNYWKSTLIAIIKIWKFIKNCSQSTLIAIFIMTMIICIVILGSNLLIKSSISKDPKIETQLVLDNSGDSVKVNVGQVIV